MDGSVCWRWRRSARLGPEPQPGLVKSVHPAWDDFTSVVWFAWRGDIALSGPTGSRGISTTKNEEQLNGRADDGPNRVNISLR
jgi:hypothetical protein